MEPPRPDERRQPAWYAVALQAAFRPELAHDVEEAYGFVVDDVAFHLNVKGPNARAQRGAAPAAAFVLRASLTDFLAIATRARKPTRSELDGSAAAFRRFVRLFPLPELSSTA